MGTMKSEVILTVALLILAIQFGYGEATSCEAGSYSSVSIFNPPEATRTYSSIIQAHWQHRSSMLDNTYQSMSWTAGDNNVGQYMEFDVGQKMLIFGVVTQGRGQSPWNDQFVSGFRVEHRLDYGTSGTVIGEFTAQNTKTSNLFAAPVEARYIRIIVLSFSVHVSMRAGLIEEACIMCPTGATSPPASSELEDCHCDVGYTGISGNTCTPCDANTYMYREQNDTFQQFLRTKTPYIVSDANDWNTSTNRFDSVCGNETCIGNTGALELGIATTGSQLNNGASIPVSFVGGDTGTRLQWGAGSIPPDFTICSVTRYSGGARRRILNSASNSAGARNWLHGHYGNRVGVNYYQGWIHSQSFPLEAKTDWVAMCASNSPNANGIGVIVNGIITSNSGGGTGSCALGINHGEPSDWQLSKVYIWNTHLSDEDLTLASSSLHSALFTDTPAAGVCLPCQANSQSQPGASVCGCDPGYTAEYGWLCQSCVSNTFKSEVGDAACTPCPDNAGSGTSSTLSTDCRCHSRYFGSNGGECNICPTNAKSLTPSPNITSCECDANYFGEHGGACTLCPANSQSVVGSTVITDCVCSPGYLGDNGGPCNIPNCPAGKYPSAPRYTVCNSEGTDPPSSRTGCATSTDCNHPNCPWGFCTGAGFWSQTYYDWLCMQGGGFCRGPPPCIEGCYDCPENSHSDENSNTVEDCTCNAGATGADGGNCPLCEAGKYKTMTGSAECVSCPLYSDSLEGSTTLDDCLCNIGLYKNTNGTFTCLSCPADSIAPSPGTISCMSCQNSSTIGDDRTSCMCSAGYVDNRVEATYSDGWIGELYQYNSAMQSSSFSYDDVTPAYTTSLLHIYYPHSGTFPWRPGSVAGRWRGFMRVTVAGVYNFHVNSDDGSWLWVDDVLTVSNGGGHGMRVRTGSATLSIGDHLVKVQWFDGGGGAGLNVHYNGPEIENWIKLPAYTKIGSGCIQCGIETDLGCMECATAQGDSCIACAAGSFKNNQTDSHCTPCASGKYISTVANIACIACPTDSQGPSASDSVENCECNPGTYTVNGECQACGAGKYSVEIGAVSFITEPIETDVVTGDIHLPEVTTNEACKKYVLGNTGYAGGYFRRYLEMRQDNPENYGCFISIRNENATRYSYSTLLIELWEWQTWWRKSNGEGVCQLCPVNTYSSVLGAVSTASCLSCPIGKASLAGSTEVSNCQCIAGTILLNDGTCEICPAGTSSQRGDVVCTDCIENTFSAPNASSCTDCPINSQSPSVSTSVVDCTCNAGTTGPDGGTCTECVAGKYKIEIGVAVCSNCLAGQYSTAIGAISNVCQQCTTHSNSPEASGTQTDCTCNAGSTGDNGGVCVECIAGKYKVPTGDASCSNCATGQYSTTVGAISDECQTCPSKSSSPEASDEQIDCSCNAGSTGPDGGSCTQCVAGKYKIPIGDAVCTGCATGQYSVSIGAISNVCQGCIVNSNSPAASDEQTDCICNIGATGPDGGSCSLCVAGKFKSVSGDQQCSDCSNGQYSTVVGGVTSNVCQACTTNSNALAGSDEQTDCTCNAGSTGPDGGVCVECIAGKYKVLIGDAVCSNCVIGQYSTAVGAISDECQGCPSKSSSPEASDEQIDCSCNAGSTGPDGGSCTQCVAGKYKIPIGDAVCTDCVTGQYSESTGATSNVCQGCIINSNSPAASGEQTDCICNIGATGPDGGSCSLCVAGKFKSVSGDQECSDCSSGQYSTVVGGVTSNVCQGCTTNSDALAGSDEHTDCTCNAGSTGSNGGVCVECIAGKYKVESGSQTCSACSTGTYLASAGASSITSCLACVAGKSTQGQDARAQEIDCIACVVGTYTENPDANAVCTQCVVDTFSAELAATSISTCTPCNATQVSVAGSSECITCQDGQYKPDSSVICTECQQSHFCSGGLAIECDANSQTVPENRRDATAAQDCRCNPGYSHRPPDEYDTNNDVSDNVCYACTPGYYNSDLGKMECSPCGPGYFSPMYTSLSVDNCDICPADTFSMAGEKECTNCTANSQAPSISGSVTDCVCNAGYTGVDGGTCTACEAGKFKISVGSALCTDCLANQYSTDIAATSNTCNNCWTDSSSPSASSEPEDCRCDAGYTGVNGGPCNACEAGKYKIPTGSDLCTDCIAGQYSTEIAAVSNECNNCPLHSNAPSASNELEDCICDAGADGPDGGTCTLCVFGKYKITTGDSMCTECQTGKSSTETGSVVNVCAK